MNLTIRVPPQPAQERELSWRRPWHQGPGDADCVLEMKVNEARQEEIDVEELWDFSENLLLNAAGTWNQSGLEGKHRLQQVLFPQGVTYSDGAYRTTATSRMFNMLETVQHEKEALVALPGIEPGFED